MPRLVLYVPFARATQSDIKQILYGVESAAPPAAAIPATTTVGVTAIDEMMLVYAGEEAGQVRAGRRDMLVVNAHGGPGDDVILGDNSGGQIAPAALLQALRPLGAAAASEVIFYCCYSSLPDHIAPLYKAAYPAQTVYGSPVACEAGRFFSGPGRGRPLKFRQAVWVHHDSVQIVP